MGWDNKDLYVDAGMRDNLHCISNANEAIIKLYDNIVKNQLPKEMSIATRNSYEMQRAVSLGGVNNDRARSSRVEDINITFQVIQIGLGAKPALY